MHNFRDGVQCRERSTLRISLSPAREGVASEETGARLKSARETRVVPARRSNGLRILHMRLPRREEGEERVTIPTGISLWSHRRTTFLVLYIFRARARAHAHASSIRYSEMKYDRFSHESSSRTLGRLHALTRKFSREYTSK